MATCKYPMHYFAAIQHTTVFGLGTTKHAALNDASEWDEIISNLDLVPCTSAAYLRLMDGNMSGVSVSSDGVMLESEEE